MAIQIKGGKFAHHGNIDWLEERTILLTLFGSRAYGTDRPESDWDFRGVCIAPQRYRDGFLLKFAQYEMQSSDEMVVAGDMNVDDPDGTIYDLLKFFKLAADCNPSIMEVLFVDDDAILYKTEEGQRLIDARQKFLSRKVLHTFRGYAIQQLRRIQTHRKWLMDPPDHQPTREEFELPDEIKLSNDQMRAALSMVQKRVDSWEIDFGALEAAEKIYIQDQMYRFLVDVMIGGEPDAFGAGKLVADVNFKAAARMLGMDSNFVEAIFKEKEYRRALKYWQQYNEWKKNRNPVRAEMEAKYGFDGKHGMHLVRLLRMCREILTEGKVLVRRPDAEELLSIRDGAWSYEKLMLWAEAEDKALIEVARKSPLPKQPDRKWLDGLCQELVAGRR